jgi:hypothetical protein
LRKLLAAFDHVLQRSEGGHVVTFETEVVELAEQARKVEVALARQEVLLLSVAPAIGDAHLVAALDVQGR